jgi:hypothetical protein
VWISAEDDPLDRWVARECRERCGPVESTVVAGVPAKRVLQGDESFRQLLVRIDRDHTAVHLSASWNPGDPDELAHRGDADHILESVRFFP